MLNFLGTHYLLDHMGMSFGFAKSKKKNQEPIDTNVMYVVHQLLPTEKFHVVWDVENNYVIYAEQTE